jgi:hypothetical protein
MDHLPQPLALRVVEKSGPRGTVEIDPKMPQSGQSGMRL